MMEILQLRWMPYNKVGGKSKYVDDAAGFIETAYSQISSPQLQLQRCNRCARLKGGGKKGMIGNDDVNN